MSPARLDAEVDGRSVSIDFGATGARRSDLGRAWAAMPPPTGHALADSPGRAPVGLWFGLAALLAWALARGQGPGLGRTLATLGAVFGSAWALGL